MVKVEKKLYKYSVDLFLELLEKITDRTNIRYKCNEADVKAWNLFCEEFPKDINKRFIKIFVEYGMQSWFNDGSTKDYSRTIRYNWIFGLASIKRWRMLPIDVNIQLTQQGLKSEYKIERQIISKELPKLVVKLRLPEENAKAKFHNTTKGFLWCLSNTTLYFHKSPKCATCKFKADCKKALEVEFPNIYIKRGYGER